MVPPPALTVLMSSIGTARSRPSILPRPAISGAPPRISATSHEVPPMSKVMRSGEPVCRRHMHPGGHAARRPRQHGGDGALGGGGEGRHAAVRLHDVGLPGGDAGGGEAPLQPRDVARQDRLQVGVDDGRAQPVVLADLRQHLAGERHAAGRHLLAHDLAHSAARARDAETRTAGTPPATRSPRRRARARYRAGPPRRADAARRRGNRRAPPPRRCSRSGTSGGGLSYMTSKIAVP